MSGCQVFKTLPEAFHAFPLWPPGDKSPRIADASGGFVVVMPGEDGYADATWEPVYVFSDKDL